MFTLFRFSTGEDWGEFMHDSMETVSTSAWLYYTSYRCIVASFVFQLVIAAVLESFSAQAEEADSVVTDEDVESFSETWKEFQADNINGLYMNIGNIGLFLKALKPPLGLGTSSSTNDILKLLKRLELKVEKKTKNKVRFDQVFIAVVLNAYKTKHKHRWQDQIDPEILKDLMETIRVHFKELPNILKTDQNIENYNNKETVFNPEMDHLSGEMVIQHFAVMMIQSICRARIARRNSLREKKKNLI